MGWKPHPLPPTLNLNIRNDFTMIKDYNYQNLDGYIKISDIEDKRYKVLLINKTFDLLSVVTLFILT